MKIYKLDDYKKAMVVKEEFPEVLDIMKAFQKDINKYRHYRPIKDVLNKLEQSIIQSEMYLNMAITIVDTKGKK